MMKNAELKHFLLNLVVLDTSLTTQYLLESLCCHSNKDLQELHTGHRQNCV